MRKRAQSGRSLPAWLAASTLVVVTLATAPNLAAQDQARVVSGTALLQQVLVPSS
ncbi:MAG: hypothetical protein ACKO3C_03005 [Betaproteobacteria bacterium]